MRPKCGLFPLIDVISCHYESHRLFVLPFNLIDKQTVTHTGMKFSQTINPLSLIAFLLLRKMHCTITRKTEPLNYFDNPKFIKALGSGLHFPLTLDQFKCSTVPKKGQRNGCILVTSSSLQANGRQNHCCFSNCRSCFGLTFCFMTWDAILYFHIEGKKNTDWACKVYQAHKTENIYICTLQVNASNLQKLV